MTSHRAEAFGMWSLILFIVRISLNIIYDVVVRNDIFYVIFTKCNFELVHDITIFEFVLVILELFYYPSSPNGSIF